MKITITADLIQEYINILAKAKWYEEEIHTMTESGFVVSINPQTKEDFIRQVYQSLIENDAVNIFIMNEKSQRAEAERIVEETIRANVATSITSSII